MTTFVEMLNAWLDLNGITEKKNLALISALDAGTYDILRNIVYPKKHVELDYAELVKALEEHSNPTPYHSGGKI